ncbi:MAG: hypothetical protein P8I02_05840 [Flavobacteriales bacterium]|nr:hypothetical protein [Flavobacteriales bacterium]
MISAAIINELIFIHLFLLKIRELSISPNDKIINGSFNIPELQRKILGNNNNDQNKIFGFLNLNLNTKLLNIKNSPIKAIRINVMELKK